MKGQGLQQCFDAVPGNLDTDTNEEERGQLGYHSHARWSQDARQTVGKSVAEQNADGDQDQSNECSQDCQRIEVMMASGVGAQGDGHGD